jgi:uncharacterized membrane protein YphA (DoxX/SURF4 family)
VATQHKALTVSGWVLTVLLALLLTFSASMKLMKNPQAVEGFAKFGYPAETLVPIGVAEVVCTVLFLIPQTAVLGAVLLTGYLGGAIATHVRASDPFVPVVVIGVLVWVALYLRDARIRALLPFRSKAP